MDETRSKKSIYCAECYQRVKRRDRSFFNCELHGSFINADSLFIGLIMLLMRSHVLRLRLAHSPAQFRH